MRRPHLIALRLVAGAVDALVVAAVFVVVLVARVALGDLQTLNLPAMRVVPYLRLLVIIVPLWLVALHWMGTYTGLRRAAPLELVSRLVRAVLLATAMLVALLFAVHLSGEISRSLLFGFAGLSFPALVVARLGMVRAAQRWLSHAPAERVLLVGRVDGLREQITEHPEWGLRVVGWCTDPSSLDLEGVDHVLATGPFSTADLRQICLACEELGVRFSLDATFLGARTSRVGLEDLDGWPMLTFSTAPANAEALLLKRMLDVGVASVGLLLAAPLLAVAAVCIRLEDGAPVLFRQERCGHFGRRFTLLKLRSMAVDAESRLPALQDQNEADGPVFKIRDDPRVTLVGRWLRRTSLDELPQLINVLRGEMSLVGPRPPLPREVERYEPWQLRRLSMRPGLTGPWQVSGRAQLDFETWMRLDLDYIDRWTLANDLRLLIATLPAVVRGTGAS